jgi:PhnB protein
VDATKRNRYLGNQPAAAATCGPQHRHGSAKHQVLGGYGKLVTGSVGLGFGWLHWFRPLVTRLQEKTMASRLNPYLNFNGNARQALEFYASVFGGNLTFSTYSDFGRNDSADADRVMHGMLETEAGYTIMAADVSHEMDYNPMAGFAVSISGDDPDILRGYWEKLSASGKTTMPLQKQVWGDEFGMCVDEFGVSWLVNIAQPQPG